MQEINIYQGDNLYSEITSGPKLVVPTGLFSDLSNTAYLLFIGDMHIRSHTKNKDPDEITYIEELPLGPNDQFSYLPSTAYI